MKENYVEVAQPIDFAALSRAYEIVNWIWATKPLQNNPHGKIPTAEVIQAVCKKLEAGMKDSGFRGSGGIEYDHGVVRIHKSLFKHYNTNA